MSRRIAVCSLALQQVVQVGARVAGRAGRARAAVEHRLVGLLPARLGEVDAPAVRGVGHERHAVAADAGRHRAVERVDAELDAADEVVDLADPEQVARPLLRQLLAPSSSTTSNICALSSPSDPPIAIPQTSRAATACAEPRRRSSSTPPWTIPYTT